MISATIVADSISTQNKRITTMKVTFPRYILAELNTHRMFSRNSASSRAIPFKRMLEAVKTNPFIPMAWQKDHTGMQGSEYLTSGVNDIEDCWLRARDAAVTEATELSQRQVTKQMANRLLETFMWHTVLITATEWENFFALRCPKYELYAGPEDIPEYLCTGRSWKDFMESNSGMAGDFDTKNPVERLKLNKGQADIHMMALAEAMWDAMNESTPEVLQEGQWHIPFVDKINYTDLQLQVLDGWNKRADSPSDMFVDAETEASIKVSTAMCARVSYTLIGEEDKAPNYENDVKLHDRLAQSGHWSPFEHCARAMTDREFSHYGRNLGGDTIGSIPYLNEEGWCGNFCGWIQYRKLFNNENIEG